MNQIAEDQTLKKFIADSIEIAAAEERQQEALVEAEELELDQLMEEAVKARLAETKGIPAILVPYCIAGKRPSIWSLQDDIECLKGNWRPDHFLVKAPGLSSLSFTITPEWDDSQPARPLTGQFVIKNIRVMDIPYRSWHQAIAAAAAQHQADKEWQQLQEQSHKSATVTPSTAERLAELIGEIVADKVGDLMEPAF